MWNTNKLEDYLRSLDVYKYLTINLFNIDVGELEELHFKILKTVDNDEVIVIFTKENKAYIHVKLREGIRPYLFIQELHSIKDKISISNEIST